MDVIIFKTFTAWGFISDPVLIIPTAAQWHVRWSISAHFHVCSKTLEFFALLSLPARCHQFCTFHYKSRKNICASNSFQIQLRLKWSLLGYRAGGARSLLSSTASHPSSHDGGEHHASSAGQSLTYGFSINSLCSFCFSLHVCEGRRNFIIFL